MNIAAKSLFATAVCAVALVTGGCAGHRQLHHGVKVSLSGAREVPPVSSMASATGAVRVDKDRSVSGSIKTVGIDAKAAHIHEAPSGANGPVIVPLAKTDTNTWSVPAGAKLSDAQYESYLAGKLYINVHSAAFPGGEIRGQIVPQ